MAQVVTIAFRDVAWDRAKKKPPRYARSLRAWAHDQGYKLSPARDPWEGTVWSHDAYEVEGATGSDIVFWIEALVDYIGDVDVDGHDESPFAWREGTDSQAPWYILRDHTAKAVDPYIAGVIEDLEDEELGAAPSGISQADVDTINRHRASLGMAPIDLGAGWTPEELREMAEGIRTTGRMQNEGTIRRLLPPRR